MRAALLLLLTLAGCVESVDDRMARSSRQYIAERDAARREEIDALRETLNKHLCEDHAEKYSCVDISTAVEDALNAIP